MSAFLSKNKNTLLIGFGLCISVALILFLVLRKKDGGSDGSSNKNRNLRNVNGPNSGPNSGPGSGPDPDPNTCFIEKKWDLYCLHLKPDDPQGSQLQCSKNIKSVLSEKSQAEIHDIVKRLKYPLKYNSSSNNDLDNIDYQGFCDEAKGDGDQDGNPCAKEYKDWYDNSDACKPFHPKGPTKCDSNTDYYAQGANSYPCKEDGEFQCESGCKGSCDSGDFPCLPSGVASSTMCETACSNKFPNGYKIDLVNKKCDHVAEPPNEKNIYTDYTSCYNALKH